MNGRGAPVLFGGSLAVEVHTLDISLLGSSLHQLPFGMAILERDEGSGEFRFVYANRRYRQFAENDIAPGRTYAEVWPSGEPHSEDLQWVLDTGDDWWARYLPGGGFLPSMKTLPYVRVLSRITVDGAAYVADFVVDNEAPLPDSAIEGESCRETGAASGAKCPADLALLARVASMASSSLTLQKVCERTLCAMADQMEDLCSAGIYVLEEDARSMRGLALFQRGRDIFSGEEPVPVSAVTDAGILVLNGYQLLTHESGGRTGRPTGLDERCARGSRWIDLAIERRGKLLGVLELGFDGQGTFGQDEIRLYHGIAAILGNAVGNARSYEAEVRNARIAEGVGLILAASMHARSEADLGRDCLQVLSEITGSEFGFIADTVRGDLRTLAISEAGMRASQMGSDPAQMLPSASKPLGLCSAIMSSGESMIANDPASHPSFTGLPLGHPPLHCLLGTPLPGKHGEVFGIVALANRPDGYGEAERLALEALAPAIVEAIERYRAERQLAENARFADELNHIESIIHATLDFDIIAQEALRTGMQALGADTAALSLYEPPNFRVVQCVGLAEDVVDRLIPEELESHSVIALKTKGPVLVEDVLTDDRVNAKHLASFGIQALMAIPLMFGGNAFGVAYYNFSHPRQYSEAEVRFGVRLSLSLSLAMENARIYETERTISNRLQEALLALPDSVPGVEFAHAYYPATDATRVGGDFYDIFELSYGHVGIAIGDVAGKGVDAAALTSLVKNSIRAHAAERGKTPAQVLRLTNEVLYKTTPVESFVTVFFAMLDCRDGRLVCANGGHTTAAIVRPGGEVVKLPVTGPLLGALPDIEIDHVETRLGLEDSLFLYTDGITEARRGKDLYGEERLFSSLAASYERRPRKLMHRVVADMMAYSHGQLRDDLAILTVRRAEAAPVAPQQQKLDLWEYESGTSAPVVLGEC